MSEHTGRRTDGHRTCFGARGNALGGCSRALTREQSGPGVALHKQQRHTMPRSRNAYDPTARDRGVGCSLILHLGTSSQGHLNSKGFEVRGNQVTEWGERAKKGAVEGKGGFRVCEVGKSSRVAVPWGQCSKNTWVAKVVSGEACFIAKLFLNPAGERQHTSGPCSEGTLEAPGRQRGCSSAGS